MVNMLGILLEKFSDFFVAIETVVVDNVIRVDVVWHIVYFITIVGVAS